MISISSVVRRGIFGYYEFLEVQEIFVELQDTYGWDGDFRTDQSASQWYAGFGWGYHGIEDWAENKHTTSAILCEVSPTHVPTAGPTADPTTAGGPIATPGKSACFFSIPKAAVTSLSIVLFSF
jgi:hypothetical protein